MSEDVRPVPTGDIRLTYVQLGARLGISAEAARVLTRRRGWQRIHPNRRGAPALVVVPEDELAGELWREQRTTPDDTGTSPDVHQDTRADKAEQRADAAERRADEANVRADRALALAADAAARADRIESALVRERERADEATRAAETALRTISSLREADDARRSMRLLARLRHAWQAR